MAMCVEVDTNTQVLYQSGQAIDSCTNYVLLHASEYINYPTLQNIFQMPVTEDMQQMWMLGFSLPIIAYLTSWAYGVVINWFNRGNDEL